MTQTLNELLAKELSERGFKPRNGAILPTHLIERLKIRDVNLAPFSASTSQLCAKLTDDKDTALFLKLAIRRLTNPFSAERDRLIWIGRFFDAPEVVDYWAGEEHEVIVTTWRTGKTVKDYVLEGGDPEGAVRRTGQFLRDLHASPAVSACPFHRDLPVLHADATLLLDMERPWEGAVPSEFEETFGTSPTEYLAPLLADFPENDRTTLVHGEANLANFLVGDDGGFSVLDTGRLGRGDRHLDLGLVIWEMEVMSVPHLVAPFLDEYGRDAIDDDRLGYFRRLAGYFWHT